ncbi:hypothetical protein ACIA58_07160 [Kribbella sp. NPDC051586]|uniref:hypothetical protein n=1 Tax=Kribbella sp. NPDC051586 TaxID=3364118 RepID=UPI0037B3DA4A
MPVVIFRRCAWTLVSSAASVRSPASVSSSPVSHLRSTNGFVTAAGSVALSLRKGDSATAIVCEPAAVVPTWFVAAMDDWTDDERNVFADLLGRFVTALDRYMSASGPRQARCRSA